MCFIILASRRAPESSALGMVIGRVGSTRALAMTSDVEMESGASIRAYMTIPYATEEASQKPCSVSVTSDAEQLKVMRGMA